MVRRWISSHRSLAGTLVSGTAIAALVATMAVVSGGYPAQKVELNDASVWVSNGSEQVIGRANTQVLELNSVVASESNEVDVVQDGALVLLFDEGGGTAAIVDPATSSIVKEVPMPTESPRLFAVGGKVVVADGDGQVWILSVEEFEHFDPRSQPTLSLGGGAVFSMDERGRLAAFSRDAGALYLIDAASTAAVLSSHELAFGDPASELSVAFFGQSWAVFDATTRSLVVDGALLDLSATIGAADRPRLQESSAEGERVLLAYAGGLLAVAAGGGGLEHLVEDAAGTPAPPLVAKGCAYAAWSGGIAWRSCDDGAAEPVLRLDSMPQEAGRLLFKRNGDRVVLNDARGGRTWAVQSRGELIDNWETLITVQRDERELLADDLDLPPVYEKVQQPPVAIDDEFGARPGRTVLLPVLLNDYDPNGDVLVVSQSGELEESVGRVDIVNNRQQIQLALAESAQGVIDFGYTVTDGRGGEASATVTVTVRTPEENSPPQQLRRSHNIVAQGGRVSTAVLGDWIDPDGDTIYLASASTSSPDVASFTPDGTVLFVEGGDASASRSIALAVTDGSAQGTGTLSIAVSPPGQVPIVADPFVVLAYAGQEVTVRPLAHVRGGNGTLRLSSVPAKTGAIIAANPEAGTFRFSSAQVRTFDLDYVVTDGDLVATGRIRVEVAAPPDANTRPITVPKTVFVTALGSETVPVADEAVDPAGGVLLVTAVDPVPASSGLQADILEQRAVRITLTAPQDDGPVSFRYRVGNGLAEATGVITVVEIPRPVRLQPPIAADDAISVRVGAAIDIPVLDNDLQPDGEPLSLNPQLTSGLERGSGLLFASGGVLRYLAPQSPGNFTASYEVSGPDGQTAQAQVRIAVRESVEATNNAPVPETVVARVLAGERVTIRIPLSGIDQDGDSVQLLGQESSPEKGAVTAVGPDSFSYQAGDYSAGTDSFGYTVIDSLGARATGTVRIGISQRQEGARNPVAVADEVSMRPGGTVTIQVLANDSDPDGSPLTVTEVAATSDPAVVAETDGTLVRVTPPAAPGQYGLLYTIQNEQGGQSSNFVTVTVSEDAARARPLVDDTVLTLTDILGRDTIDVDVLANAFFADGPVSGLRVGLLSGYDRAASVTADRRIAVAVGQKRQIIPFSVTNPDDTSIVSYAFLWVPGYDDALPQLNRKARPLTIPSESTLRIPLNDYVIAIGGKAVRLTDSTMVSATHSDGSALVIDDQTLAFTSADQYFGPASISFEVTDGATADDREGRRATLVLPITVTPRENQPPVFNGAIIDFEPAQEKVLDLLRLTDYPYPDDLDELDYTALAPLPVGFSYTLTGQVLTIRAREDAAKGTTTALVLGVRDDLSEGKAGRIQLNVVASSRPLARPAADIAIAPRAATTMVDVLANDEATNPFPGEQLTVRGIRGIDGASLPPGVRITPSADFRTLAVTVAADAPAQDVNLQYQVADATKDPDRYVWGTVTLQIQDVPDPVTGVQVRGFGDESLTISWSPGAFNNSPITGFEVTARRVDTGALIGVTPCAVTNGCTIRTPGNGPANQVRVAVVAINSIGASEPASIGSPVWSDVLPAAPGEVSAVPTGTAPAGGSLSIAWSAVADPVRGSPVSGYTVRITGPGVDLRRSVAAGTTSLAFENSAGLLVPASSYSVSVYARNSAQVAGERSWLRHPPVSVTAVGPPGSPAGGVTGVVVDALGRIQVSWGASSPQGAPAVGYSVGRFDSLAPLPTSCSVPTPGTSGDLGGTRLWIDEGVQDQHRYRYVVYADNGYYCTPTASGEILTMRLPGKASGSLALEPHGGQWDLRIGEDLAVASESAARFQYRIDGSGGWRDVPENRFITSIENSAVYGTALTVAFRGCRDLEGLFCGAPSEDWTRTPVNARASVVSCVVGAQVGTNPPVNANRPEVGFRYAFDTGSGFGDYGPDATVPAPLVPLLGTTKVRVKAVVSLGVDGPAEHPGRDYLDPGYAEATCSEPPE